MDQTPAEVNSQLELIRYLLSDHRAHDALEAARNAQTWLPKDDRVKAFLADAHVAVGDYAAALAALRPLAAKSSELRLKYAETLLLAGRSEECLAVLAQVAKQSPRSHLPVARLYVAALEPERALTVLSKSAAELSSPEDLAFLGMLNLTTGRYGFAAAAFRRGLSARPGDPTLSFYLGVSLRLGGKAVDLGEAVSALNTAVAGKPDGRMFHYELGLARAASGDRDGALEALGQAVKASPNIAEVLRDQATLLDLAQRPAEAAHARATYFRNLADREAAIAALAHWTDQNDPTALATAAGAFSERGDGNSTQKLLDRLPSLEALPVPALWEAYRSYRAIARNDEAMATLERLRALTPDDVRVRDEQADTLQTLNKYAESEVILRDLQQLEPQNPYRPYQLGLYHVLWSPKPDAKSEAERWFREAIRISPGFAGPRYRLGLLLLESKQPKAAIIQFRRALGISPRFADGLRGLARAYEAAGEKPLALETFRLQREVAEKDSLIERLKQPKKGQDVPLQNRSALVKIYLRENQPEDALSQLEVLSHSGKPTLEERKLLVRLYGIARRFQRQDEERRAIGKL